MVPRPFMIDPAFSCSLSVDELSMLGVIAVSWGQVDFMLDEILAHAHGFDKKQRDLFITDKMVGTKIDLLKKAIDQLPEELQPKTRELITAVNNIKPDRNSAFHGIWGWFVPKKKNRLIPAAWHHKRINNPLKADQLEALAKKTMECSKLAWSISTELLELPGGSGKFIWGADGDGPPPEWIQKEFGPAQAGRRPEDRKK